MTRLLLAVPALFAVAALAGAVGPPLTRSRRQLGSGRHDHGHRHRIRERGSRRCPALVRRRVARRDRAGGARGER